MTNDFGKLCRQKPEYGDSLVYKYGGSALVYKNAAAGKWGTFRIRFTFDVPQNAIDWLDTTLKDVSITGYASWQVTAWGSVTNMGYKDADRHIISTWGDLSAVASPFYKQGAWGIYCSLKNEAISQGLSWGDIFTVYNPKFTVHVKNGREQVVVTDPETGESINYMYGGSIPGTITITQQNPDGVSETIETREVAAAANTDGTDASNSPPVVTLVFGSNGKISEVR